MRTKTCYDKLVIVLRACVGDTLSRGRIRQLEKY